MRESGGGRARARVHGAGAEQAHRTRRSTWSKRSRKHRRVLVDRGRRSRILVGQSVGVSASAKHQNVRERTASSAFWCVFGLNHGQWMQRGWAHADRALVHLGADPPRASARGEKKAETRVQEGRKCASGAGARLRSHHYAYGTSSASLRRWRATGTPAGQRGKHDDSKESEHREPSRRGREPQRVPPEGQ